MTIENLEKQYFRLAKELENTYPKLSFQNHCYWRIALDNTVGDKWDKIIKRPAYQNLNKGQLKEVVDLLTSYLENKDLLLEHNQLSLSYRKR